MYSNTGYRHSLEKDFFKTPSQTEDLPLYILSCGVYRLVKKKQLATLRPLGRQDYQLLYINKGNARFHFSGQNEIELKAGHMVLYRPFEIQEYSYDLKDQPEVYWLHFAGTNAETILEQASLFSDSCLYTGCSQDYVSLFLAIILELQQKRPYTDQILLSLFQQLLYTIRRHLTESPQPKEHPYPEVKQAVSYFHQHYSLELSIQEYALSHNISACWFIRSFKKQMGMTPLQYITWLRIQKASELLETTSYPIQEISELVGYENPLYFSRIFKEKTGYSPREYRSMTRR